MPAPEVPCASCGRDIAGDGPAVVNDFHSEPHWVAFVEDLRSSPHELRHPSCFAKEHGVDRLVEVVHKHDEMMRTDSLRSWQTIQELKDRARPDDSA